MKRITVAALVLLSLLASCASTEGSGPALTGQAVIIEAPEKTKDELFVLANSWAVDAFGSAEAVIEFSDKEAGIIKGSFTVAHSGFWSGCGSSRTTVTVEAKDGRVRLSFADPFYRYPEGTLFVPSGWQALHDENILRELNAVWESMAESLRAALAATPVEW